MDDEKQSINISSNFKRGYIKIKIVFLRNIGLKPGHAPASFATKRILSEKLRFSCFSQVPSGSDYPIFRPILLKTFFNFDFYSLFFVRKLLCLLPHRSENRLCNLYKHNDTEGNSENDSPLHKAWRGYIKELIDSRSNDYA